MNRRDTVVRGRDEGGGDLAAGSGNEKLLAQLISVQRACTSREVAGDIVRWRVNVGSYGSPFFVAALHPVCSM
jgi:hypothetical protein